MPSLAVQKIEVVKGPGITAPLQLEERGTDEYGTWWDTWLDRGDTAPALGNIYTVKLYLADGSSETYYDAIENIPDIRADITNPAANTVYQPQIDFAWHFDGNFDYIGTCDVELNEQMSTDWQELYDAESQPLNPSNSYTLPFSQHKVTLTTGKT